MKLFNFFLFWFCSCSLIAQSINYPPTEVSLSYDTIQRTVIVNEFKWLEQTNNPDVRNWINQQNSFTDRYLRKNTEILTVQEAINDIADVDYNLGIKQGSYYFKFLYNFNSPTPAIYFHKKLTDPPMLLVDPRSISIKDRIEISSLKLSKNENHLAFQYNRNGSDWHEISIVDVRNRKNLREVLRDVRFSDINWLGNGFFYSRYKRSSNPYDTVSDQEIWYHEVGHDQNQDILVYSAQNGATVSLSIRITSDERFLIVTEADEEKNTNKIFYRDMQDPSGKTQPLLDGEAAAISIIDSHNNQFIGISNYKNNNGSIVSFSPTNPTKWTAIVDELEDAIIVEAKIFRNGIITIVQSELSEYIFIYDWEGNVKKILTFAPGYKVSGFINSKDQLKMLFYYSSFTLPPVVFELDLETYQYRKTIDKTVVGFDYEKFIYERIEYPSKDGTKIPMLLIYRNGIKKNGSNPVLLNSYGGFGVVTRPHFEPGLVHFLNKGGIYAYAYIRGEGAKGINWTLQGRGIHKQTSFDDFIAAAEYLVSAKYTIPSKLAITGASNGGLVVGAAITQRPELFKVAVPVVGVFDMLRLEKETVGIFHKDEYGTITDSTLFQNLLSYSPLHKLVPGKKYPSVLIITGENDDRVPPYHSYKFAAKLQQLSQGNPVLLRVILKAGHHGDNTWEGQNRRDSEVYAFVLQQLKN